MFARIAQVLVHHVLFKYAARLCKSDIETTVQI